VTIQHRQLEKASEQTGHQIEQRQTTESANLGVISQSIRVKRHIVESSAHSRRQGARRGPCRPLINSDELSKALMEQGFALLIAYH